MDRLNRIAWLVIGLLIVVLVAFGLYLLFPLGDGSIDRDPAAQRDGTVASSESPSPAPGSPAVTATPRASLPPRRVQSTGVIEQVSGSAFTVRSDTGSTKRIVLKADARMIRLTSMPGPSAIQVGDAVIVTTETIIRDPFRPPDDTGRVRGVLVFQDGLPPEASSQCPQIGARSGSVVAFEQGQMRLDTICGEQVLDIPPATPVQRVSTAQPTDLKAGQRVALGGEELPDGSISGAFVQILDS